MAFAIPAADISIIVVFAFFCTINADSLTQPTHLVLNCTGGS